MNAQSLNDGVQVVQNPVPLVYRDGIQDQIPQKLFYDTMQRRVVPSMVLPQAPMPLQQQYYAYPSPPKPMQSKSSFFMRH